MFRRASSISRSLIVSGCRARTVRHLDNKALRRGVFLSVADLQASIHSFLQAWKQHPKPFVWTATIESIQEKLNRCRRTLEQIQPGCTTSKSRKRKK